MTKIYEVTYICTLLKKYGRKYCATSTSLHGHPYNKILHLLSFYNNFIIDIKVSQMTRFILGAYQSFEHLRIFVAMCFVAFILLYLQKVYIPSFLITFSVEFVELYLIRKHAGNNSFHGRMVTCHVCEIHSQHKQK